MCRLGAYARGHGILCRHESSVFPPPLPYLIVFRILAVNSIVLAWLFLFARQHQFAVGKLVSHSIHHARGRVQNVCGQQVAVFIVCHINTSICVEPPCRVGQSSSSIWRRNSCAAWRPRYPALLCRSRAPLTLSRWLGCILHDPSR